MASSFAKVVEMIIPAMTYKDAAKAVDWLRDAFGLTVGSVTMGKSGTVAHAEMWYGGACVMFGSADPDSEWDATPATAGVYVVVDDVDAHFERAKAAGAEIMYGPRDTDYGSREYGARDFEGNAWSFGTYVPSNP